MFVCSGEHPGSWTDLEVVAVLKEPALEVHDKLEVGVLVGAHVPLGNVNQIWLHLGVHGERELVRLHGCKRFCERHTEGLVTSENSNVSSESGSLEQKLSVLEEVDVDTDFLQSVSQSPRLGSNVPNEKLTEVQVSGVVKILVVFCLGNNGSAETGHLIEDVQEDQVSYWDFENLSDSEHLVFVGIHDHSFVESTGGYVSDEFPSINSGDDGQEVLEWCRATNHSQKY